MTKEYLSNPKDGSIEWPVLFESFLRPSSTNSLPVIVPDLRDRAWSLYVDRRPYKGERPPESHFDDFQRQSIHTPEFTDSSYLQASGNSVVITSNIASTSTTGKSPGLLNGPGLGIHKDRAIMQMSKRIQVLKGNAQTAATRRRHSELLLSSANARASSASATCAPSAPTRKSFVTQEQVIKMLRLVKAPTREVTVPVEARIRNKEKVLAGLKGREQDTAPGYCENCRLRYVDLSAVSPAPEPS